MTRVTATMDRCLIGVRPPLIISRPTKRVMGTAMWPQRKATPAEVSMRYLDTTAAEHRMAAADRIASPSCRERRRGNCPAFLRLEIR